ncbi:MAG: protein-disulfide reductase DsbD family protein, partial [Rhodospirillales bacterium]
SVPGLSVPGLSVPGASAWHETKQTALRLISATETTGAATTLRFGLHFKLKPHWKIYWRSPGDAGFPPQPDWSRSENVKSATIHWPAPVRFSVLGLETLGYEDEVVLPMTVERTDPAKPVSVAGTVRYLTCKEICIPYEADLALTLPGGPVRPSPFAHLIGRYQSAVPGDGGRHGLAIEAADTWTRGDATVLRVRVRAAAPFKAPDLYVEGPPPLAFSKPLVRLGGDARSAFLELEVYGVESLTDPPARTLAGRELTLTLIDSPRTAERTMSVAAVPGGAAPTGAQSPLAVILALAVLGGLILNLMPCVLPVLSIKLLGVVGHGGGERRTVRLSFIASAAGILFAFAVLAAALVALKAGGMAIGWGIQFQQPWFLVAMTLLVTAFACNLWGFFEVRLPVWIADLGEHAGHVHGLGGHFLQGAFATLLATPCSAPFLGTAVGFAFARGAAEIFAVFAALALGLALPYLTVAAFPGLATRLPRPGPWMVTLRRVLGLALAATGVWLLSVLQASAGLGAAAAVGALAAAAAGFLYWRHRAPDGPGRRAPLLVGVVAVAAFLVPGWLADAPAGAAPGSLSPAVLTAAQPAGLWRPSDEATIPALVAAGKTVFVEVTADWCLTCQVNKAFVLGDAEIMAAFRRDDVVVMQADWTRPDPVIAAYLARYQRYGIPFDVVYGPGAPAG